MPHIVVNCDDARARELAGIVGPEGLLEQIPVVPKYFVLLLELLVDRDLSLRDDLLHANQ